MSVTNVLRKDWVAMACCLLLACVTSAQGLGDAPDLKAHFNNAGLTFHDQMKGLRPTAPPVHTEAGTKIVGIPYYEKHRANRNGLLWHLESGELDFLAPPDMPGTDIVWSNFALPNARGEIACSTKWRDKNGDTRYTTFLLSDDRETIKIERKDRVTHARALNDLGLITGIHQLPNRQMSQAYVWSVESGMQDLPTPKKCEALAFGINAWGDVVGGIWGKSIRGAVWLAPKEPGESYTLIELHPPKGSESTRALGINDQRQVLVDVNSTVWDAKNEKNIYQSYPYIWTREKGYTKLQGPEHDSVYPFGIDREGNVLLQVRERQQADPQKPIYPYYLHREGENFLLPTYPGADRTDYFHMSEYGLIVGVARFFSTNKVRWEPDGVVGFVISLITPDAEKK